MPISDFCDDLARAVAFLSRIPVADRFFTGHDGRMSRMVRAFPLAGLVIALPAAAVFGLLLWLPADPLLASLIALAVLTLTTGALHEDGLGDTADGLGGGRDREQALAIMKDSRIGSYGAIALILSFALRAAALSAIAAALSPLAAAATLLAAAVISRAAMVWHWRILPPAKSLGVAAAAGRPDGRPVQLALASATLLVAVLLIPAQSFPAFLAAVLLTAALTHAVTNRIRTALGGHTGDTIGATQQIAEITTLCALALAA